MRRRLFDGNGLRAAAAAASVTDAGPVRWGPDGHFWVYRDGLWSPGEPEVHRRIVVTLGERYRPAHAQAIRDVMRALVPTIDIEPISSVINVQNGLIDWDAPYAPMLMKHSPDTLSTVQIPWRWAEEPSSCAEFEAFLEASVAPDDRPRVWEILGYLLMSGNPLQRMFLLTGGGGNGKGVFLAVIRALLGRANVSSVALTEFTDDVFAGADVYGKLCNICGDIDTGHIEKTGKIKALAGEDEVRAQRKFEHGFNFEWWGKAVFSANGMPTSSDPSEGWRRRWEVVSFPNKPARKDPGLKRRLTTRSSLEAIMVRAVLALRDLMERGEFHRGEAATRTHELFAIRNDKVLAWVHDPDSGGYIDPSSWYPRKHLLGLFRLWDRHENPGSRDMGSQTFYERMRGVSGVREVKNGGVWGFRGLRLFTDAHVVEIDEPEPPEKLPHDDGSEPLFELDHASDQGG